MKKLILALFLFGFASSAVVSDFTITDEKGSTQSSVTMSPELNIQTGIAQQYKISATNLSSDAIVTFKNNSKGNIILFLNAGVASKSQVVYQVGFDKNSFTSDYYALSSCQVDKNTENRPTRSFLIINRGDTKFLRFFLRDCETGKIITNTNNTNNANNAEKLNIETTLLAIETKMSDNSIDYRKQNGSRKTYALPTVIIGQETVRDFSTRSAKTGQEEFFCRTSNNIKSLELYDGDNKKVSSFSHSYLDGKGSKIKFTIENKPGTNYRKMHFKITCNSELTGKIEQLYYFDARPEKIVVKNLPKEDEWLYAEQRYKSDGSAYNDGFDNFRKLKIGDKFTIVKTGEKVSLGEKCDDCEKVIANKLKAKTMKAITLTPVDAKGVAIADYNSISEIAIVGKIYSDGTNKNIINETTSGDTLIRPCVVGSRAGCEIALAEINGATSEIYTDIINNKTKVIAYNNVGPTVLYGVDTEWTKYSQTYQAGTLCDKFESHSEERVSGSAQPLVGCNIPFVAEKEGDELNFYTFKPAVYKTLFEGKNSPANASYGTDKLTYIHTIEPKDYNAAKNEIFEAADFNASILAIGASLASLKNNRALSHYDNHLKVAQKLKISGNPANPTITIDGTSKANDIAADFSIAASNNKTDISGAIILTLEPTNPYNHKEGYKSSSTSTDITTERDSININMPNDNFYAGKNIKVNKLNFKREDLLARNYAYIGKSSVDIDMGSNATLNDKIEKEHAAFIFGYTGNDLHFVDAAIIAPNVASNEDTADSAVYLAGYCEPASHAICKTSGIFISDVIAGHMNYFGFASPSTEITTNGLFSYDGAKLAQFRNGADFLGSFTANEVKIELKGDKAEEYCNIFRNCYKLGDKKFGTTFNSYKVRSTTQWHGSGEQQGPTIVDGTARRKDQRLGF
ncbi:MAG: hypothetical protein SPJ69_06455 [Campylobacter sp.]|uniref:hypothetical protein n=1 Tax=Campylobacter sp. TaxID=205 RepID=UPI00297723E9|nr:hypothetical protein [Campylobacter sp.]MDD7600638.1 hypothetical protein [Campylobacteraceae bacterium]MDY5887943.1 hypothetical protein [Campylobacter sp.]